MTQKTRQKWVSRYIIICIYNKIMLNWKKGLCGALHLDALFQTKKNLNILNDPGPRNTGNKIKKIIKREKRKKIFRFFKNKPCFRAADWKNHQNFSPKKRYLVKTYIISERSEDGLSSHTLNSISKFLMKNRLFWRGGVALIA